MTEHKNLRAMLQDHKTKTKPSQRSTLRIPWTIDADLADELEALKEERAELVAARDLRAAALDDEDDRRAGTHPASEYTEAEKKQLDDLDKRIAEVEKAGNDATLTLVFMAVSPSTYDQIENSSLALEGVTPGERAGWQQTHLADASFKGVQSGDSDELDTSMSWIEIRDFTTDDGAPLMTAGVANIIENRVVAINMGRIDTPFSSTSSGGTR